MQQAYQIFLENAVYLQELRDEHFAATGEPGQFVYGWTKFFDISRAEFRATYLTYKPSARVLEAHRTIPVHKALGNINVRGTSVDWRSKGVITAVKDQGQCGSCWAFSTTEGVESFSALAGKPLTSMAPEQIVDCDTVDQGCNGGDLPTAFAYVKKYGLESEADYPYTAGGGTSGSCRYKSADVVANISGFTYATPPCTGACDSQNENTLLTNLAQTGPSSICVNAAPWQFYTSGIMKTGCSHGYNDLDHCVQLVGYDGTGTTPYWIVRNSWAASWGEQGYIYLEYGKNLCGVADEATFVTI